MAVGKDEGDARWWFGGLAVIKATAADTGGQMAIIEVTEPPGAEAPFTSITGKMKALAPRGSATFEVGGMTIEAEAGDYLFGPRDIPHRYTVGDAGCRMLFIMTPGGFEEFVIATSEPAGGRTLPPSTREAGLGARGRHRWSIRGELLGSPPRPRLQTNLSRPLS